MMEETLRALLPNVFFGSVIVLAIAETLIPLRSGNLALGRRWATNISLYLIGLGLNKLLLPISAFAVALALEGSGSGLLPLLDRGLGWGTLAATVAGVLLFDLWKYAEHWCYHKVRLLWRLHQVHHADLDVDFTTTERHHPIEIISSALSTMIAIYLLGISPLALSCFLLLAFPVTVLAHTNISIGSKLDAGLRSVIVTPAFHAIHHSALRRETDSNYGNIFSFWDRIFGTWVEPDMSEAKKRVLGLEYFRDPLWSRIDRTLWMPFTTAPSLISETPEAVSEDRGTSR